MPPRGRRAAAEAEVQPGWLGHLLDATASAIVALDRAGRVLYWNAAAERLFGWPRAEVVGKRLPIVPPTLQQEWQLQMQHVLAEGQSTPAAETQRITRDGRLVSVLRSSAPLQDAEGRPVGLVDTLTDISAHKQLDEESRALVRVRERMRPSCSRHRTRHRDPSSVS